MKLRIATWAAAGTVVVALWSLYLGGFHPDPHETPWFLLDLTVPIALLRHQAMSVDLVLAVNAVTYALFGLLVEATRRFRSRPHAIST